MKKVIYLTIVILSFFYFVNSIRSIVALWHKQDLIVKAQEELTKSKEEQGALQKKLQSAQNPLFIEEEARDKLFLTKPGEYTVLVPKNPAQNGDHAEEQKANWQQWVDLFLY